MKFTEVYKKVPEGYIGFVEELPGANTQGKTLEETRANLQEAIELTPEANRILAEEFNFEKPVMPHAAPLGLRMCGDSAFL